MCSVGCSNWGSGVISQHPVMSRVAFLFMKRLENATVNVAVGKSLSKTRRTDPRMENVRLKHSSWRFAYLRIPAVHKCILCVPGQRMTYVTKNMRNNDTGC